MVENWKNHLLSSSLHPGIYQDCSHLSVNTNTPEYLPSHSCQSPAAALSAVSAPLSRSSACSGAAYREGPEFSFSAEAAGSLLFEKPFTTVYPWNRARIFNIVKRNWVLEVKPLLLSIQRYCGWHNREVNSPWDYLQTRDLQTSDLPILRAGPLRPLTEVFILSTNHMKKGDWRFKEHNYTQF